MVQFQKPGQTILSGVFSFNDKTQASCQEQVLACHDAKFFSTLSEKYRW